MSLSAEQAATVDENEPTTSDNTAPQGDDAPASGEQPTELAPSDAPAEENGTTEAEGQKPEEEKPEPEKTPEQQRAWRQVEAAKREQIKVAKAREELKRDVDRVQQYEQRLTASYQQRTRDLDARESRVKPLEDALQRRDLSSLQALGFDFAAFARESMEANTPEGIAKRALERADKLEKERAEERKQAEERERQQASIRATRQDAQNLVAMVEEQPDACPELYAWAPERVAQEGIAVRDAYARQTGRMPTYEMVLNELAKRARAEASVQQKRQTSLQQKRSASTSDAGSAGKADPNRTSVGGNPPALTNRTATERAPSTRELTEEEKDALNLAELRALRR